MGEAMITRRGGGGLKIDGLLDEYIVSSGSVSAGDFVKWVFGIKPYGVAGETNTSLTYEICAAMIDEAHVLLLYEYKTTSKIYACVVTFNADGMTVGISTQITTVSTDTLEICAYAIGNNQFLIAIKQNYWMFGTVTIESDNTITLSKKPDSMTSINTNIGYIWQIEENKFAGGYCANNYYYQYVMAWENNAMTMKKGSKYSSIADSQTSSYVSDSIALGGGKYVCFVSVSLNSDAAKLLEVYYTYTGTNVTVNSIAQIKGVTPGGVGMHKLSDGKYIVPCGMKTHGTIMYMGVIIITVGTNAVSLGTPTQISAKDTNLGQRRDRVHIGSLKGSRVILIKNFTGGTSDKANYILLRVNGAEITTLTDQTFITGPDASDSLRFGNSAIANMGKKVVMFYSMYSYKSIQTLVADDGIAKCASGEYVCGLATEDGAENETIKVYRPA